MNTQEFEALVKDVRDKLAALPSQAQIVEATSEERLRALIRPILEEALGAENFARKMRFAGKATGSKYERLGMTVADIEWMHSVLGAAKQSGRSRGPSEQLTRAFNDLSQARYGLPDDNFDGPHARAMDTAESGYGSQLVGAQYVAELWEGASKQAMIFPLFETFEMTAPTAYLPVEADLPEMLFVSESTASNSSNYTTSKTGSNRVTVTAVKFVIHQMWSGEMEEDSLIPFVSFLRRQASKSLAHYSDSVILNGDTTNAATANINLVDADPADTKHYLALDGLRHGALIDNTGNATSAAGAALAWGDFIDLRDLMIDRTYLHDWGQPIDPTDLVYITMPEIANDAVELDEVITVDKYGSGAGVLTGEIARIGRHPLISSIALAKSNTAGKVSTTAGNNLYGEIVAVNRRGAVVGWRRRVKVETERIPATDQSRIVYSLRMGLGRFAPTGAASGIEWVADRYYIAI